MTRSVEDLLPPFRARPYGLRDDGWETGYEVVDSTNRPVPGMRWAGGKFATGHVRARKTAERKAHRLNAAVRT